MRMLTPRVILIQLQLHQRLASVAQCVLNIVQRIVLRFGEISKEEQYVERVFMRERLRSDCRGSCR